MKPFYLPALTRLSRLMFIALLMLLSTIPAFGGDTVPIQAAHAHNDYYHDRPLLDALSNGFCSVEADVFLVDGRLLVAHSSDELDASKTLQSLYLNPLQARVKQNGGRVYPNGPEFTLLVDFKSAGPDTYRALLRQIEPYREMLTSCQDGIVTQRAVQLVISGNRPIELIAAAAGPRYLFVDGRLSDLEREPKASLMPLISDRWGSHFEWQGSGEISPDEKEKLTSIVEKAHSRKQRVRFWATPDLPAVWKALHDADVDLINTDDLPGLAGFLNGKKND